MTDAGVSGKVLRQLGRAMGEFSMLRPGDHVAVGVSGGKDSLCLVHALAAHRARAPFSYRLTAVTIEQGKFTTPIHRAAAAMERVGVPWVVREEPRTLALVAGGVAHGCDVCSRNRRAALYAVAEELDCNVIALGHTADDCAEALFRNILFNGRVASLPPVAESRQGGMRVIRPLAYVDEESTAAYVAEHELAPIGCVCAEKAGPRQEIRRFLKDIRSRHPDAPLSIRRALANVNPYTLFDPKLSKADADAPAFARDGFMSGVEK